ncbi:MAG: RHS repeat protein, partial [Gammaproteobacteria bacterium]|nr:RHS repeat protein [Gammaproteobacteria bacterium]
MLSPWAQASISQSVRLPNQEYSESSEDLKVKVLGGHVRINRSWVAGQWYLNPAWANLRFQPDPLGGVLAIDRAGSMYTRLAGGTGTDVYAFGPDNFIARQESGWRWYDRLGNSVTYDVQGRILSYTDVAGISVHFVYGSNGVLKEVQDHHGQPALTLTSDEQGRVTQVSDAREPGRSVHYRWSGNGPASLLSEVTDVLGHRWLYEYNSNGQITQRTDPLGATVKLTYMSNPKPIPSSPGFAGMGTGSSNPDGTPVQVGSGSTKVSGPPIARVASYTNEAGATTHYRVEWDRTRQQYTLHSQEPNGLERTTVYDKDGRVLRSRAGGLVNTQRSVDSATQERMTDARGQVTTYQYNSARQPVRIIHPDGSSERFSYDSHGRKTEHINTLGIISRWEYNAQGKETLYTEAVGQPEQRSTRSTYDPHGQLISQTLGAGDATGSDAITYTFAYDAYGNRIKTTDPLGHTTQLSYNSQGLPTQQTDALNNVSRYSYDAAGHLLTATNALNETVTHTYDARGRKIKSLSAEGLEQISHYDSAGRLIELRAPGQDEGHGTRIQYDSMGRPIQTTSPSGLISSTEFDQLGRMVKTTDPAGNVITYAYGDADSPLAGLLTAVQYPTYKETYQYDQRGRQTAITQHLGGAVTRTQHQSHDAMGQVVSSTDPAGRTTLYQYDRLGRLTQITDPLAQTTQHSWDAHDNLLSLTDAAGNTHRFAYSKVGQLLKETRPLGGAIQYRYNAAGYLTQRIDAANNTRTYRYDAAGRLIEEEHTLPNGTRDQLSQYTYNKDGQLTGYEQTDGSNQLISSATYDLDEQGRTKTGTTTYGKIGTTDSVSFTTGQSFNADGQLDSHTYPDGSQQKYSYHHGQLSSITLPNQSEISYDSYKWVMPGQITVPGASKTVTYDALLRPTGITVKNQQTPGQTLAQRLYQYDTSGNISQIQSDLGITDYGYDKLDRLIEASPDTALQSLGLPQE